MSDRHQPMAKRRRLQAVPTHRDGEVLGHDGFCNALLKGQTERRCRNKAGAGTDHVGYGACKKHGGNSPALSKHAAKVQVRELADELDMDPDEALKWCVRLSAGAVFWLQRQIAELGDATDEESLLQRELVMQAYGEERDRLAKTSKLAIDAGIAEREVSVLESQAALFANVLERIFHDLKLNAEQRALAPKIARAALLELPAAGQTA